MKAIRILGIVFGLVLALLAAGAGLLLNKAAKKFGLLPASSPLPRRSISAFASS